MPKIKEFKPTFDLDRNYNVLTISNIPGGRKSLRTRSLTGDITAIFNGDRPVGLMIFDASKRAVEIEKVLKSNAYEQGRSLRDVTRELISDVVSLADSRNLLLQYPSERIHEPLLSEAV